MTKFSDLALDPRVLRAVSEAGYDNPTPIQAQAIPHALEGRDILGIAQTGTGKTASFSLPMITILGKGRARARMPRSLVLAPTRELAAQVAENFDTYAKHTKLTKALLIGGVAFGEQDKLIDRGVDVLIATPGRLLDHFERGKLLLNGVQIMVVDEADRMLDMGFIPDIEKIFSLTPFTRQTFFYSATMAPEIERVTNTFLSAAVKIEVARQNSTSDTIEQKLIELPSTRRDRAFADKRALLRALIRAEGESCTNAIIFCNRKMDVDVVAKSLKAHGFNAAPIHGDLDQSVRTRTLENFREDKLQILVASDVAARGLDVPSVSHVFNFDVPTHPEDYVHRIGRTGRAGRKGKAYTLAVPADEKYVTAIEALVSKPIPRGEVPEGFASEQRPERPRRDTAEGEGEGRNRRTRSRGGRDRGEREAKPAAVIEAVATEAEATEVAAPVAAERAPQPARQNERRERNGERGGERGGERREREDRERNSSERPVNERQDRNNGRDHREQNRDQNRDRRGDRRDDRVVGMGDHVPDFILRSFRLPERPEVIDLDEAPETQPETVFEDDLNNDMAAPMEKTAEPQSEKSQEKSGEKSRSRSRTRSRGGRNKDQAKGQAAQGEDAPVAVSETAAVVEAATEAPAAEAPVAAVEEAPAPVAAPQAAAPEAAVVVESADVKAAE